LADSKQSYDPVKRIRSYQLKLLDKSGN